MHISWVISGKSIPDRAASTKGGMGTRGQDGLAGVGRGWEVPSSLGIS